MVRFGLRHTGHLEWKVMLQPGDVVGPLDRCLLRIALAACFMMLTARGSLGLAPDDVRQNLFSACFLNEHEGWIVGELGRVLKTTDGTGTLQQLDVGTKSAFTSIACFPDKTLFVVGPRGSARRSRNGGETWDVLDTGTKRNLLSVAFATPDLGIAVGDFGTIVRTEDGGNTWNRIPIPDNIPLPEEIAQTIDPGDVLLYDAVFTSPERAWIVGEFGVILTTTDGGKSWTAQHSPIETTLFGVDFSDAQRGWAVGIESVMVHTTDGGETWRRQSVPAPRGLFLSLYDVDVEGQFGWVVGDSGLILHSTDRGETWTRVDVPISFAGNWLRAVSLTAGGFGFMVGSDGLILPIIRNDLALRKPAR
jgi:photosystem II stability/assembly factor-like uncharacterized protein